jgi:hypothetical protein
MAANDSKNSHPAKAAPLEMKNENDPKPCMAMLSQGRSMITPQVVAGLSQTMQPAVAPAAQSPQQAAPVAPAGPKIPSPMGTMTNGPPAPKEH